MKNICKGIWLLIFFFPSICPTFSIEVGDFSTLQEVIDRNESPLQITNPRINWPVNSALKINYSPTFTSAISEITFDGQRSSQMFVVAQPTTWGTGESNAFTFQNAYAKGINKSGGAISALGTTITFNNPTLFRDNVLTNSASGNGGAAIYASNSRVIFNDAATFMNNEVDSFYGGAKGAGINAHSSVLTFSGPAVFKDNSALNGGGLSLAKTQTTFFNSAIFTGNYGDYGGAIRISDGVLTFNGPVVFKGNTAEKYGAGINAVSSPTIIFNDTAAFIDNVAERLGGAIAAFAGQTTFARSASFSDNISPLGAAIYNAGTITFNDTTTFTNGIASNNGGAIFNAGTITFNDTATFTNNIAGNKGGAIFIVNSGEITFHTINPSAPTVFSGNIPQAIYFNGAGRITFDTAAGTMVDVQDGIESANNRSTIIKQGAGTWKQAGNSSGYRGNTNVKGGTFELQPGAVYGTTASGTFTSDPDATLAFNFAHVGAAPFPLLQAANVNLNGITSTDSKFKAGEGTVIRSGKPILVNGASFSAGDLLTNGKTLFYDWQFLFKSPNEVILSSTQIQTIRAITEEAGGNENETSISEVLDAVDVGIHPESLLVENIFEIKNSATPQEVRQRVDPLQGQILTGAYDLLWNQITNFTIQVDDHLNISPCITNEFIQGASKGMNGPLICGRPSPWVAWGQILGGRGYQSSYRYNNGYDSVNGGLIAGFDRFLDPNWRLGVAVTYQRGTLDWAKYNSETRGDTVGGIVYGAYSCNAWFAQSQVGGGGSRVKNRRDIPLGLIQQPDMTAFSSTTLPFFLSRAEWGYHFDYKEFRLTPSLGLLYLHSQNSAYAESGAGDFNLSVKSAHRNNLEAQGFFEVSYNALINERPVTFRVNYGLGYAALDKQTTLTTGFLAFPNLPTFPTSSLNLGRWRQIGEVGVNVEVAKNVRLLFDYIGLFMPHQYNQTGAIGIKVVF